MHQRDRLGVEVILYHSHEDIAPGRPAYEP